MVALNMPPLMHKVTVFNGNTGGVKSKQNLSPNFL